MTKVERVVFLSLEDPSSMVVQNAKLVSKKIGVYNCVPNSKTNPQKWADEASLILGHWLSRAKDVWTVHMSNKDLHMVFFRDNQGRIIYVKEMLIQLKFAQNNGFVLKTAETKKLEELKSDWTELFDLKIDYSQFSIIPKRTDNPEPLPDFPQAKRSRLDDPEPADGNTEDHFKFYAGKDPVFIYGKEHPVPYTSWDTIPYPNNLKQSIPSGICCSGDITIQMYVWPTIKTGGSAIVIEPKINRKFIFEPVVFDYVFEQINLNKYDDTAMAVVIVDTRQAAENLWNYFDLLNKGFTVQVRVKTVLDCHGLEADELAEKVNCDLLITTLPMMKTLFRRRLDGFNLHTVKMLVFQNVHNMRPAEFQDMLSHFGPLNKKQVIITSRFCFRGLKKLYADIKKPIICFGSPIEVAFNENTTMMVKIANNEMEQLQQLIDVAKQSVSSAIRTAIVCKTVDALKLVKDALNYHGIESSSFEDPPNGSNLLLLMDKHIKTMKVGTVGVLVHFSVPKWSVFSQRFLLFEDHFVNKTPTNTHVLLNTDEYDKFLPEMENLVCRKNLNGMKPLVKQLSDLKRRSEGLPTHVGRAFCEHIAVFGQCAQPLSCASRHSLNDNDVPDGRLPRQGQVELRISSVISPSHFLVEVLPANKKVRQQWQHDQLALKLDLASFFADKANRVPRRAELLPGDLCIILVGQYRRARVCSITSPGKVSSFVYVEVQCLETGNKFRLQPGIDEILEMPERFRDLLPQVIDAHLLGFIPFEEDSQWCPSSLNHLKLKLSFFKNERFVIKATVAMVLGQRLYLSSLKVLEHLTCGVPILSLDIKEWLLAQSFAKVNSKGLNVLRKMAEEFELDAKVIVPLDCVEDMEDIQPIVDTKLVTNTNTVPQDDNEPSGTVPDLADDSGLASEQMEEFWEDDNEEVFEYEAPEEFDFDDNFDGDEEELMMLLMGGLNLSQSHAQQSAAQQSFQSATIEELPEEDCPPKAPQKVTNDLPFLKTAIRFPEIYWSQSDNEIKLRLSATDVQDYTIDVDNQCMEIFLVFPDGGVRGGVIHFFGEIDSTGYMDVQLRGLVILVTMTKTLPGAQFHWPRLLATKQPARWLKYYQQFDHVDYDELDEEYCISNVTQDREYQDDHRPDTVDMDYLS